MYYLYYYRKEFTYTFPFAGMAFTFAERTVDKNGTEYVVMDEDGNFVHKKDLVLSSEVS